MFGKRVGRLPVDPKRGCFGWSFQSKTVSFSVLTVFLSPHFEWVGHFFAPKTVRLRWGACVPTVATLAPLLGSIISFVWLLCRNPGL